MLTPKPAQTRSTMSSFSRDALAIVENILPKQFGGQEHDTIVGGRAEAIMTSADGKTKLYAQCQSGSDKRVFMMSPTLRRELKKLAQNGAGHSVVVNEVKYKFLSRKFFLSAH